MKITEAFAHSLNLYMFAVFQMWQPVNHTPHNRQKIPQMRKKKKKMPPCRIAPRRQCARHGKRFVHVNSRCLFGG